MSHVLRESEPNPPGRLSAGRAKVQFRPELALGVALTALQAGCEPQSGTGTGSPTSSGDHEAQHAGVALRGNRPVQTKDVNYPASGANLG